MVQLRLEESKRRPRTPVDTVSLETSDFQERRLSEEEHTLAALRGEVDAMCAVVRTLSGLDPGEVMLILSGYTARLTEIRIQAWRCQSRRFDALRTHEIDPLLEECDRQFRIHSRLQAMRQLDWEIAKGQG